MDRRDARRVRPALRPGDARSRAADTDPDLQRGAGLTEQHEVHGMCHITGGGLLNLTRLTRLGFAITTRSCLPPVFAWLQEQGRVSTAEMYRTFNMGMGFAMVVPGHEADAVARSVPGAKVVGRCTDRTRHPARRTPNRVKEEKNPILRLRHRRRGRTAPVSPCPRRSPVPGRVLDHERDREVACLGVRDLGLQVFCPNPLLVLGPGNDPRRAPRGPAREPPRRS